MSALRSSWPFYLTHTPAAQDFAFGDSRIVIGDSVLPPRAPAEEDEEGVEAARAEEGFEDAAARKQAAGRLIVEHQGF